MQKEGLVSCQRDEQISVLPPTASSSSPQSFGSEFLWADITNHLADASTSPNLWTSPRSRRHHV